jgi:SAM-dependent methyltransferase
VADLRGGSFFDDIATQYCLHEGSGRFSPNHVMEEPAMLAEVGYPTGLRVIDLGCGDGRFGLHLLDEGCANYLGIDGSPTMLSSAEGLLADRDAELRLGDLEDFAAPAGSADLITARLSLHYLSNPDLAAVLAAAAVALAPAGRLIFTIVHPVITSHDTGAPGPRTSWLVDDYFVTGPRQRDWFGGKVTWYHRTVEQYVQALADAGFALTALRECMPVPERFDGDTEELTRRRRVPLFLLLNARAGT